MRRRIRGPSRDPASNGTHQSRPVSLFCLRASSCVSDSQHTHYGAYVNKIFSHSHGMQSFSPALPAPRAGYAGSNAPPAGNSAGVESIRTRDGLPAIAFSEGGSAIFPLSAFRFPLSALLWPVCRTKAQCIDSIGSSLKSALRPDPRSHSIAVRRPNHRLDRWLI